MSYFAISVLLAFSSAFVSSLPVASLTLCISKSREGVSGEHRLSGSVGSSTCIFTNGKTTKIRSGLTYDEWDGLAVNEDECNNHKHYAIRTIGQWKELLNEVVEFPSLELLKKRRDEPSIKDG